MQYYIVHDQLIFVNNNNHINYYYCLVIKNYYEALRGSFM